MALVIGPDEGSRLYGTFDVRIKVRGEDTGGVMAAIEEVVPAHTLISPHVHANDVWVYVLSGRIGILVGDEVAEAGPGSWALKPRNVPHAMWNADSEPARVMEILTPAGTEHWFEELAHSTEDFASLCERYGIRFLPESPWNEELRGRYDVK